MSWQWVALRPEPPDDAQAVAAIHELDGRPAGYLAVWRDRAEAPAGGVRIDTRAIDLAGGPAWISLALARSGVSLHFDDPAVIGATRAALALPIPPDLLSTLIVDEMRFAGAVMAVRDHPRRLEDNPFAAIFPARILHLDDGLLGTMPSPVGPGTQRYGAGQPWPGDHFKTGAGID